MSVTYAPSSFKYNNTSNLCFHCQHEMSIAEDPFEDRGLYFVCKRIVFNRLQPFRLFPLISGFVKRYVTPFQCRQTKLSLALAPCVENKVQQKYYKNTTCIAIILLMIGKTDYGIGSL